MSRHCRDRYGPGDLKGDVFGGVVSAVMMVPVALGFGVLSGLGPVAAFYGAIAVGFFTAVLGGAAPMISGPSAIVTIFTAVIIGTYADDLGEAFTIVMLAGLLQIAFGALRLGRFVNWLPVSVVRGVFVGVGCYILREPDAVVPGRSGRARHRAPRHHRVLAAGGGEPERGRARPWRSSPWPCSSCGRPSCTRWFPTPSWR